LQETEFSGIIHIIDARIINMNKLIETCSMTAFKAILYGLVTVIFLFSISGCTGNDNSGFTESQGRVISFSGLDWRVKSSGENRVGPGPNYFSDSEDNVMVDEQGRLHLKITFRDGRWYCSGIETVKSYGHDKYVFYISSRPDSLDKQVVWGLYTYSNDQEEIDIEFSRWGIDRNQEAQYVVQPSKPGNRVRFRMNLEGSYTTHIIDWKRKRIDFASYHGHRLRPERETDEIAQWSYTGKDVPPDNDERLKINLWLFRGAAPSDNREAEVVINRVEIR